jgi:hypothetical protein
MAISLRSTLHARQPGKYFREGITGRKLAIAGTTLRASIWFRLLRREPLGDLPIFACS